MLVDPKHAEESSLEQDAEMAALRDRETKRLAARDKVMAVLEPVAPLAGVSGEVVAATCCDVDAFVVPSHAPPKVPSK